MDAPEPSFTHTRALTIEWGDCDPAGIVFYPRYFAFFDASTAALFSAALGMPKIAWRAAHGIEGIPMVDTRGRFLVPCAYGDAVTIESRIARFGRSSFDVLHQLRKADGTLAVEGTETRVWSARDPDNPGRLRAATIPDSVKAALGAR